MPEVTTTGLQASAAISASALQQIQWAVAVGTSDTIIAAYPVPNKALSDGLALAFRASATSTLTNPTFNPDGLGNVVITKRGGTALAVGDIIANAEYIVRYNQALGHWEILRV